MHREQADTKDDSGWYFAESTEGSFSSSLPIPFNDFTILADDPNVGQIRTYIVGAKNTEGYKFTITEMELNDKMHFPNFENLISEFQDKDSELISHTEEEYGSMPCLTLNTKNESMGAFMRYIHGPHSTFTLIIEYPLSKNETIDTYRDYFFSSFKLKSTEPGSAHNERKRSS
ncbi:hypothetical protein VDG1235_1876 [Verrucomicrobiia bacterium DG1235]|nr:hypothetical protein VDG1235_1876 [Verrucomicrobiae bacterium DG1235]